MHACVCVSCTCRLSLPPQLSQLQGDPDLTRQQYETEVKRICVMLEQRMRQIFGGYKMTHCSYFRNPAVVVAVAHLLYKRRLPAWADEHLGFKDSEGEEEEEEGGSGGE